MVLRRYNTKLTIEEFLFRLKNIKTAAFVQ
jgi:hypothetical protein